MTEGLSFESTGPGNGAAVSDPHGTRDQSRRPNVAAFGAVLAAWRRGGHLQQEEIMSSAMDPTPTSPMAGGAAAEQSPELDDGRTGGGAMGAPAGRADYYDDRQSYPERPGYGRPPFEDRHGYYSDRGRDRQWEDDRGRYERQGSYGHSRDRYDGDHDDSSFADGASRFARQHLRTGETKEFFKTSEFFVTLIGVAALIIAAAVQDNFDAHGMWRLVTALLIAYVLSRGIAKAGSDKREGRSRNSGR
jgi:hypothetical protein